MAPVTPASSVSSDDGFDENGDMGIPKWSEQLNDGNPLGDAINRMRSDFKPLFNEPRVHYENGIFELAYDASASRQDVEAFLAAVADLPAVDGLTITTKPQDFSLAASMVIVHRIFDDREQWYKLLGSTMHGLYASHDTGAIHITVNAGAMKSARAKIKEIDGVPVVFDAYPEVIDMQVGPQQNGSAAGAR